MQDKHLIPYQQKVQMAGCFTCCICWRSDLYRIIFNKCSWSNLWCDSIKPKKRCFCRNRYLYCFHWSSECKTCCWKWLNIINDHWLYKGLPFCWNLFLTRSHWITDHSHSLHQKSTWIYPDRNPCYMDHWNDLSGNRNLCSRYQRRILQPVPYIWNDRLLKIGRNIR